MTHTAPGPQSTQILNLPADHSDRHRSVVYRRHPKGYWEWWYHGWRRDECDRPGPRGEYAGTVLSWWSTWAEPYEADHAGWDID